MTEGHDVTKLPKWAQDRIRKLEGDLAAAQEVLALGPEDSEVFAEPYADVPRPIGKRPIIRFSLGAHDGGDLYADAWIDEDGDAFRSLRVRVSGRGAGRLHVSPESSNVVRLWGETPYEEGVRTGARPVVSSFSGGDT